MNAKGNDAITLLFQRHGAQVYRRALRLLGNPADAEEATQEVFVRVLRGADGFQHGSLMSTWLYQITTNYCLNAIRDRARRAELHVEHVAPMAAMADTASPPRPDELLMLRRILGEADEQQARAAIYVYLDGMSHEEAAELLGVSKRTVGNLLDRLQAWANRSDGPAATAKAAPKGRATREISASRATAGRA